MSLSRRQVLKVASAGLLLAGAGGASTTRNAAAQSGGLLERLKTEGVIKVGVVDAPPYSGLNPDGTVTGIATRVCEAVLKRLGIPKMEAYVAPYSQQIPGLLAARWDLVASSLTITAERCQQVMYSDPVSYDGAVIAYIAAKLPDPPDSIAAIGERKLAVGMASGSYLLKKAEQAGIPKGDIQVYPDNTALLDGLEAGRIQVAVSPSLRHIRHLRNNSYEVVFPLKDDEPHGSAPACRKADTDFYEAFQRELKELKKSGEFEKIAKESNYEVAPRLRQASGKRH